MRILLLIWTFFLGATCIYGQGETSNWYFGQRAGIRFNNDGSVTPLEDGRIQTFEGCATISDPFGELLFYTDGITVYNRIHGVMNNGRGLYGDISSTQSGIIVPDPGNPDLYYIFTVDTTVFETDPDFGLNYSIVDMSLDNGLGEVIVKNVSLLNDCSEKITAVLKDCSDQSIWLLTLSTPDGSPGLLDTFHAFEISTTGIDPVSVKSTFSGLDIQDPRGYLKLSPEGDKVACANGISGLYLYDFDSSTGLMTNQEKIEIGGVNKVPYGVEFSPNGELLYVHASNDQFGEEAQHSSTLYQYDLTATDISASEILLDKRSDFRAALQLGANGKIYRTIASSYTSGSPYLAVINNPNERGVAAAYEHFAVNLGSRNATQGLPPFVQSFFNKTAIIRNEDGTTSNSLELCEGEGFLLQTDDIPGAVYEWDKDGIPLPTTGNLYQITDATDEDSGRYSVTITTPDPAECPIVGEAFIKVNPVPEAVDLFLAQCDVDPGASEDGLSVFNLKESILDTDLEYTFFSGQQDLNNDLAIESPDEYFNTVPFDQVLFYRATNEFGCSAIGTLTLEVRPNPFAVQADHTLYNCDEDPLEGQLISSFDLQSFAADQYPGVQLTFHEYAEDVSLKLNPLPPSYQSTSSLIYARLELDNECLGVDRIALEVLPTPIFELDETFLLCTDGSPISVEAPAGFDSYRWERLDGGNGSPLSELSGVRITEIGNYRLTAVYEYQVPGSTIRCENSADFQVLPSNRAVFEEVDIDDFTENNSVQVLVSGDGDYEYSLDGLSYQGTNSFNNIAAGFYTVYVRDRNGCGISSREISVLGYPKFFTPNGDGINDVWRITGTSEQFQPDAFITIYDRYGKLLAQISPLGEGWDGMLSSNPLPATDYWFRVELSDGREITGHFALKR